MQTGSGDSIESDRECKKKPAAIGPLTRPRITSHLQKPRKH